MEVWKDVAKFEDRLMVSNLGRVFAKKRGKIISLQDSRGYYGFTICVKGKVHSLKVHKLVAEAFIEAPTKELILECSKMVYGKPVVRHLDNNKKNNSSSNLAWGTYKENYDDYWNSSESPRRVNGTKHYLSRLTDEDVKYIRSVYAPGHKEFGATALGKKYDVHHSVISRVARAESYKV